MISDDDDDDDDDDCDGDGDDDDDGGEGRGRRVRMRMGARMTALSGIAIHQATVILLGIYYGMTIILASLLK